MKNLRMKFKIKIIVILLFVFYSQKAFADDKLLQSSDLTYLGAFLTPTGDYGSPQYSGLSYGGRGLAYNAAHNSLFIVGHLDYQMTTEISIASPVKTMDVNSMNTATPLQNFSDVTEGNRNNIGIGGGNCNNSGNYIGGQLVYNNKLIGSVWGYYDAASPPCGQLSHFTSGLNLSTVGDFGGMFRLGPSNLVSSASFMGGPMCTIPADYQNSLGGTAIAASGPMGIAARSSVGPAAFAFDPDRLGIDNPVNVGSLVYYDDPDATHLHTTLGWWQSGQQLPYNSTVDSVNGVVFPDSSKTLLFFGKHGSGVSCYGPATANSSEAHDNAWLSANYSSGEYNCGGNIMSASEISAGDSCCYDPDYASEKGVHSYPNLHFVWAYNADDLAAAKSGTYTVTDSDYNSGRFKYVSNTSNYAISNLGVGQVVHPWNVYPYASWNLDTDMNPFRGDIRGVAYDSSNKKIYISLSGRGDSNTNYHSYPAILVYQVNASSTNKYSVSDFALLVSKWFNKGDDNSSDLNLDKIINSKDLGIMMSKWN